jgi:2-keto-3-deoxy-L-fuconate dehydrogenase
LKEFDGLTALVTGGASGIGAATVELLAERGATVASLDLTSAKPAGCSFAFVCDIADGTAARVAVDQAAEIMGGLDIVVNNAGIGAQGDVTANDDEEWRHVFEVNVRGAARVTATALPYLRRSNHAAVVNTCSVAAVVGLPDRALYSATKGALLALTLAMAADHVREGIRVNAVAPGTADTPWVGRLLSSAPDSAAAARALRERQPLGRLISAAEVAHAIAYLCSPLAGSTTGTVLGVDGGMANLRLPHRGSS